MNNGTFEQLVKDLKAEEENATRSVMAKGGTGSDKYYDGRLAAFQRALVHAEYHKGESERLVPDKPKVRLEELTKIAIDAYSGFPDGCGHNKALVKSIQAICAHLGIELEPEKAEWEVEFDKDLSQAGFADEGEKLKAKADYKLGWLACERRKKS